jgi:AraC-like DNA-binding protein
VRLALHGLTIPMRELLRPEPVAFADIPKSGEQLAKNEKQLRLNSVEPKIVWRARRVIERSSADVISLSKVAKAVNVSPSHLSEKFKQVTGVNFVDYVARIRFEKARANLDDVDLRISEIAFASGFQSLSQFNRVFKRLAGMSPTQYRAARKQAIKAR